MLGGGSKYSLSLSFLLERGCLYPFKCQGTCDKFSLWFSQSHLHLAWNNGKRSFVHSPWGYEVLWSPLTTLQDSPYSLASPASPSLDWKWVGINAGIPGFPLFLVCSAWIVLDLPSEGPWQILYIRTFEVSTKIPQHQEKPNLTSCYICIWGRPKSHVFISPSVGRIGAGGGQQREPQMCVRK